MDTCSKRFLVLSILFLAVMAAVLLPGILPSAQAHSPEAPQPTLPTSCYEILLGGASTGDGVYTIDPDGPDGNAAVDVYCDMTTDGGGWTLVASTRDTTLNDQGSAYYADLASLSPAAGHEGIWDGMLPVAWSAESDVRFSCRNQAYSGAFDVDLAFYAVGWYSEFAASHDDADVCFEEDDGNGQTLPPVARRNLLTGDFRPLGDQWNAGYMEGEDNCDDTGDFTVDFDDRGMDSNQSDGTDWGEDDGSRKCGDSGIAGGTWFIWVREPVGLFLEPAEQAGGAEPGDSVTYTLLLANFTGASDSFNVAVAGNQWPTTPSASVIGPIANTQGITFTVQVDVPPGAAVADLDLASISVTSVTSPTQFSVSSQLETHALSGQYGYIFNANNDEINLVDTVLHFNTGIAIDTSPYGNWPWEGALSPDGSLLYVSLRDSDLVLVIDTASHTPVTTVPVGDFPHGVAFSPAGTHAFVANSDADSISVIDTSTHTVVNTIPVAEWPQAIAVSPCLDKLYVTHRFDYSISVIDLDTLAVIDTITGFNDQLWDIVISPYGHRAYVTNQWDQVIYVIDTIHDTWIDTLVVGAESLEGIDIAPDGSHLYATSNAGGVLFTLQANTGRMDGLIPVARGNWERGGWQVEVFPASAGPFVYVTAPGAGQVTAVNTNSNQVVAAIAVGGGPRGLALFPPAAACLSGAVLLEPAQAYEYGQAGDTLVFTSTVVNLTGSTGSFDLALSGAAWDASLALNNTGSLAHMEEISFTVAVDIPAGALWGDYDEIILTATSSSNPGLYNMSYLTAAVPRPGYVFAKDENLIHILDTQFHQHTGSVIDASTYGSDIWRGALSPDGSWLYASYQNSPVVLVVDTVTQQPVISITVGSKPHGIAFTADSAYAYVANRDSDSVSIIDTSTHTVVDTLVVGDGPTSLAYVPCLDKIYVGNEWDGSISVIDTALMTVTSVITGFDSPRDVVASPYGKYVYVANAGDSSIGVIDTATDAWIATWEVEGAMWLASLEVSPVGHRLYAADSGNGYIYVLNSTTGAMIANFMIGTGEEDQQAWELELFPAGLGPYAYVSVPEANVLRVFNALTNTLIGTIYGGDGARGVTLFPQETICGSELCFPLVMRNFP